MPPDDTRAALRGRFVREAKAKGARYSCDWTRLTLMSPHHSEMVLLDPFDFEESERFRQMMDMLA